MAKIEASILSADLARLGEQARETDFMTSWFLDIIFSPNVLFRGWILGLAHPFG